MDTSQISELNTEVSFDLERPSSKPSSKLCFRLSIIFSIVWGVALIGFFIYFLADPTFKMHLLEFSRRHGSHSFLNIIE